HGLARPLHVDLVDVFGPGGSHALIWTIVMGFVVVPILAVLYGARFANLRRSLQMGLAARLPSRAGGPAICRECGAALEVPPDAHGVRCVYCGADNLVNLPAESLARAKAKSSGLHARIKDAMEEYDAVQLKSRVDLKNQAAVCLAALPVLWLLGM